MLPPHGPIYTVNEDKRANIQTISYFSKLLLLKHRLTWLVVEETADTSFRGVKESCCHGVIFSICTEQLKEQKCEATIRVAQLEKEEDPQTVHLYVLVEDFSVHVFVS